ncbi:MAG: hypothetical protein NW226_19360 [Microscillaceae bacterium]|nr:hypothetical protein [Microscillaceae bacterium]
MKLKNILGIILLSALVNACNTSTQKSNTVVDTTGQTTQEENTTPKVVVDEVATARARIMAGVALKNNAGYDSILNAPATQEHYRQFNQSWAKLEESRLSKIRKWRESELKTLNSEKHNLFYPFSGPDFLNAYEFFPNCDNYILFGLEPNGRLVDIQNMPPDYLAGIRKALNEIFERNYFITSFMSNDLWGKGVLPVINIFMARTGNQIVDMKRFYLTKEGKPEFFALEDENTGKGKVEGIMIEFLNENKDKSQKVYYFGTDVEDSKMKDKMELAAFIKSFPDKIAFLKSASYILQNTTFQTMLKLVLDETSAVLQDDTGVPYREFVKNGWDIQYYGKYARPVADFGGYTYQSDMQRAFQDSANQVKPLDFTFGYHWKTDNSSVLLCTKKK